MFQSVLDVFFPTTCQLCGKSDRQYFCAQCLLSLQVNAYRSDTLVVFGHNPQLVNLVRIWKEQHNLAIQRILQSALVQSLEQFPARLTLTCIPTRPASQRARGGSPLTNLVAAAASELGRDFNPELLSYKRKVQEQRGLNFARRTANLEDAFVSTKSGFEILLIDDVITSGATLRSAKTALQKTNQVALTVALVAAHSSGLTNKLPKAVEKLL